MSNNDSLTNKKKKDLAIAKRIREYMDSLGYQPKDILVKLKNVPQSTFAKWISDKPSVIRGIRDINDLKRIAEILNTNVEYLLYGGKDSSIEELVKEELKNNPEKYNSILSTSKKDARNGLTTIKCYHNFKASVRGFKNSSLLIKPTYMDFPTDYLSKHYGIEKFHNLIMVIISGSEMEPIYHDNDYIFLETGVSASNDDIVVAKYDNKIFCRIFTKDKSKPNEIILKSYNNSCPDVIINQEQDSYDIIGIAKTRSFI